MFVVALMLALLVATMPGSLRVTPRYLTPFAWLVCIPFAIAVQAAICRLRGRSADRR